MTSSWLLAGLLLGGAFLGGERLGVKDPKAAEAKAHYNAGVKLANAHDYPGAIAELEKAYAAKPEPAFLLMLAETWRKKPDCGEALDYYQKYLEAAPKAGNARQVQQIVESLKAEMAKDSSQESACSPPPSPTPTP